MGYYMEMWVENPVRIPEKSLPKLAAKMLKKYISKDKREPLEPGDEFDYVQHMLVERAALESTRVGVGGSYFLEISQWTGEKGGDWLAHTLGLIAPYVVDGGMFECRGEDGVQWRWEFRGGTLLEFSPVVLWENAQTYRIEEVR